MVGGDRERPHLKLLRAAFRLIAERKPSDRIGPVASLEGNGTIVMAIDIPEAIPAARDVVAMLAQDGPRGPAEQFLAFLVPENDPLARIPCESRMAGPCDPVERFRKRPRGAWPVQPGRTVSGCGPGVCCIRINESFSRARYASLFGSVGVSCPGSTSNWRRPRPSSARRRRRWLIGPTAIAIHWLAWASKRRHAPCPRPPTCPPGRHRPTVQAVQRRDRLPGTTLRAVRVAV